MQIILCIIGLYLHKELYCSFSGREFVDHTIEIYFMRGKYHITYHITLQGKILMVYICSMVNIFYR